MRNYSLLSDHDFELLIADLFRAETGKVWEPFARGADRGVDLRRIVSASEIEVVQCKHMLNSTFSQLKAQARKEATNLENLSPQPTSYHFVTTQSLTQANKSDLLNILHKWIDRPDRILGAEDLEGLLNLHSEVERAHTKLWISGAGQLDAQINSAIWERSRQLRLDLNASLPRYVETKSFTDARSQLHAENVIVICGPPGIGKTTLGKLLVADAANDNFEPVQVSADIEEGNSVITPSHKQIFYYDDFLGETFLDDRLTKNEDKRLASFMRHCANSRGNLFVLTTREHVFQQAINLYRELDRAGAPLHKFILRLENYSRYEKARILYNHVWHSGQLDTASRAALANPQGYGRIIDHPNYNPRLIEYVTGLASHRLNKADNADFVGFATHILDHPDEIWRQAFSHQLDDACRDILIALASLPPLTANEDLNSAFLGAVEARGVVPGHGAYKSALRVLEDSFTRSQVRDGTVFITFANPSVRDFVTEWATENSDSTLTALSGTVFFEQLVWFSSRTTASLAPTAKIHFASTLANKVQTLWLTNDPRWQSIYMDDEPRPSFRRRYIQQEERLEFICQITANSPGLALELQEWFDQKLAEIHASWAKWVANPENPVRLVKALKKYGRLDMKTFDAAADALASKIVDYYQWDQLQELEEFDPEWFGGARSEQMREKYKVWMDGTLEYPDGIRDDDELRSIRYLADKMDVEVDDGLLESAAADISARPNQDGYDDDDDYDRGNSARSEPDESAAICALFERLNDS